MAQTAQLRRFELVENEAQRVFTLQRQAYLRHPYPSLEERRESLTKLERVLLDNVDAIADAINRDFGHRSAEESKMLELFTCIDGIRHTRGKLAKWMKPQRRHVSVLFATGTNRLIPQPKGVVGIVSPWNYPLYLALGPIVPALAAGNRVMVKMSEAAPETGRLLGELVAKRFDPETLSVVNGGPEVARAFVALPFDHLLFTGSTEIGRHVMRAAAENLTPVTLELGGKSPAIVGRGIAIGEAARRILYGKCLNAGQTCVAPDYVLVPEERLDDFVRSAATAVSALYPTLRDNPDYTAIVNDRQRARLEACLDDASAKGARVVELNPAREDLAGSPKMAPRLLTGVNDDMRVMREEIFGPLLPVVPYRTLDEAIGFVNRRPRPLALYVFDHDEAAIERILAETVSGGVTVNETLLHLAQEDLPFGGVGPSGMGEYHGRAGFETFSKRKAVFRQARLNGLKLFHPPYGPRVEALAKFLFR
jgi:acyl-CoA reductase-like NAD-dependent aldehyde dehydrogenase